MRELDIVRASGDQDGISPAFSGVEDGRAFFVRDLRALFERGSIQLEPRVRTVKRRDIGPHRAFDPARAAVVPKQNRVVHPVGAALRKANHRGGECAGCGERGEPRHERR